MLLLFGTISLLAISGSNGQQSCTTSLGSQGSCINIKQCDPLLDILRSVPLPVQDRAILTKSQCGVDGDVPKVCCPLDGKVRKSATGSPNPSQGPPDVTNHPNLRLLRNDICGGLLSEDKIYGGNKTSVLEFPWMALIGYRVDNTQVISFRCGASVISKRYILTAAHCVTGLSRRYKLTNVRVGEHDLSKEKDCNYKNGTEDVCADPYQDIPIERVHFPSRYRTSTLGSDIALIRVKRDIDFEKNNVKPICLPVGNSTTLKSNKAMVTGWGLNETEKYSETLVKVTLPIIPNAECARIYKTQLNIDVLGNQLCAGGEDGKDSCNGDSGGPLQFPQVSNGWPQYFQYGLVSYGPTLCGRPGIPGVYTEIVHYMDWILDTMED